MTKQAQGTFDVKLTPHVSDEAGVDATPGRLKIEKQFHGDLEATSMGQMLAATSGVKGSAGYVAIEKVSGNLAGHNGTFVLQHSGTMTRGEGKLTITVVPDSGTGELEGISGSMTIQIEGGKHSYEFAYTLITS